MDIKPVNVGARLNVRARHASVEWWAEWPQSGLRAASRNIAALGCGHLRRGAISPTLFMGCDTVPKYR
jgi:hypothetical protein